MINAWVQGHFSALSCCWCADVCGTSWCGLRWGSCAGFMAGVVTTAGEATCKSWLWYCKPDEEKQGNYALRAEKLHWTAFDCQKVLVVLFKWNLPLWRKGAPPGPRDQCLSWLQQEQARPGGVEVPERLFLAFLVSCVTLLCISNSPLLCGPSLRLWGRESNTVQTSPCSPLEEGATVIFHNFCSCLFSGK